MDEFEQQQANETTANTETNGTSRRNFLKVAVVGSATAAAAVGAAGVAASALGARTPSGLSKILALNADVVSTINACATNTSYVKVDPSDSSTYLNGNENLYVWAWFTLGDTGTYTANFTAPLPSTLTYTGSNQQVAYPGVTGCPSGKPDVTPSGSGDSAPFTFTNSTAGSTVLIQFHLNASGQGATPPATPITLTVEVTGPSGYDTTATTTLYFFN